MIRLMKEEDLGAVAQLEQSVFLCRGQNVICVKVFCDRNIFFLCQRMKERLQDMRDFS